MTKSKLKDKKIFTTGAVAKLFGININTVIKWFDEGKINGFRLPISNDRRIPISSLREFMAKNNIPMDLLEEDGPMRRQFTRFDYDLPIEFTVSNGKAYGPYPGRLQNISEGGACISTVGLEGLTIPTHTLQLDFMVDSGPLSEVPMRGEIIRMQPGNDELAIGMKFFADDPNFQQKIHSFIETNF